MYKRQGPGRFKFDGIFPIPFETYGEKNPNGYFYSEFYGCNYNEGSSKEDALAFVSGFNNAVAEADYSETGYHYGNYFAEDNTATNPNEIKLNLIFSLELTRFGGVYCLFE